MPYVAPAKARLKSFLVICPIDTIVLVTDVPMLAPITIGMASFTVNTGKKNTCINHALKCSSLTRVKPQVIYISSGSQMAYR